MPFPNVPGATFGIDVSNWQGHIDWPKVATTGCKFAIIKAGGDEDSAGGYPFTDPWYVDDVAGCWDNGVLPGAYYFANPARSSPADSVTSFVTALDKALPVLIHVLDIEVGYDGDLSQWVAEWLDLFERTVKRRPRMYSANWFAGPHGLEIPGLSRWPLMWADYSSPLTGGLMVPGWEQPVRLRQFTSRLTLPGIIGAVDGDIYYGKLSELIAEGKV